MVYDSKYSNAYVKEALFSFVSGCSLTKLFLVIFSYLLMRNWMFPLLKRHMNPARIFYSHYAIFWQHCFVLGVSISQIRIG